MTKTQHPLYNIWNLMKQRCSNPNCLNFKYYGGRGIKVCPEWQNFDTFLQDMGDRPEGYTLDRLDSAGDYCKANCRWATHKEQCWKRSKSQVEFEGTSLVISEWARRTGIDEMTLRNRLAKYPPEKAICTPLQFHSDKHAGLPPNAWHIEYEGKFRESNIKKRSPDLKTLQAAVERWREYRANMPGQGTLSIIRKHGESETLVLELQN